MSRPAVTTLAASIFVASAAVVATPAAAAQGSAARQVEPVVLTGAQLPQWSRLPAEGVAAPHDPTSKVRDAHNGTLVVPPDARSGASVEEITGFAWDGVTWKEIPVQVDERFPYFLANYRSSFGVYSGTDKELTYEWDVESWKKTAGQCEATYPETDDTRMKGYPTRDPVATLDDDDEVVMMASDAGERAPAGVLGPPETTNQRYEIRLTDPLDPASERYVYLFRRPGGSSFDASNGYVHYERDDDADQWIDRYSFSEDDPEKLGTSNTNYGPNLDGTVCDPDGTIRQSGDDPDSDQSSRPDRFARDGVTVSTDSYEWYASGRWMIREMHVARPGQPGVYGPDLIDRWKGRAFQQSPESSISLVGFEDEQVNWEANSSLLGERMGPVRAIREVWGADSGTNVTKTEYFYRDAIAYRYRVRVHPIPPDGLYTSWDYNHDAVSTYYNELLTEDDALREGGVPIDGRNDDVGNIDRLGSFPAFFDAPDPTFTKPLAMYNWEQVSGSDDNGSLVYMFELKNAQALENPTVIPYYRDDACFDDGTGDDPSPHPHPGDPYTSEEKSRIPCYTEAPDGYAGPYRQGAFGSHGLHYLFTNDTDNTFSPERTTEIDGQQWQWAVPTATPQAVGDPYANTVKTPLVAATSLQSNTPARHSTTIEVGGDHSGQVSDPATFSARLSSNGRPLAGKTISFTLDGENVGSGRTDENGVASVQAIVDGVARTATMRASFAGDGTYAPTDASRAFEVLREDTSMSLQVAGRDRLVATATLVDADSGRPLASKTVHFFINSQAYASSTTNDDGVATTSFRKSRFKPGSVLEAVFHEDQAYRASSARVERRT